MVLSLVISASSGKTGKLPQSPGRCKADVLLFRWLLREFAFSGSMPALTHIVTTAQLLQAIAQFQFQQVAQ